FVKGGIQKFGAGFVGVAYGDHIPAPSPSRQTDSAMGLKIYVGYSIDKLVGLFYIFIRPTGWFVVPQVRGIAKRHGGAKRKLATTEDASHGRTIESVDAALR
ncbi:MAG: hypothetical protein JSW10_00255, partial [Pseudomonadota bacterium]